MLSYTVIGLFAYRAECHVPSLQNVRALWSTLKFSEVRRARN